MCIRDSPYSYQPCFLCIGRDVLGDSSHSRHVVSSRPRRPRRSHCDLADTNVHRWDFPDIGRSAIFAVWRRGIVAALADTSDTALGLCGDPICNQLRGDQRHIFVRVYRVRAVVPDVWVILRAALGICLCPAIQAQRQARGQSR